MGVYVLTKALKEKLLKETWRVKQKSAHVYKDGSSNSLCGLTRQDTMEVDLHDYDLNHLCGRCIARLTNARVYQLKAEGVNKPFRLLDSSISRTIMRSLADGPKRHHDIIRHRSQSGHITYYIRRLRQVGLIELRDVKYQLTNKGILMFQALESLDRISTMTEPQLKKLAEKPFDVFEVPKDYLELKKIIREVIKEVD